MSNPDFLDLFTGQLNKLNEVIKKKNQNYKDYTIFMTNLNTSIGALAMSVQKLNSDLPSHLSKYGKDLEDNNRKINDLQGKLAENQDIMNKNNKEKQDLTEKMVELNNEITVLTSEINEFKAQIDEIKAKSDLEKTDIKNQMAEADKAQKLELAKQLEDVKTQYETEKQDLLSQIQKAKEELDNTNKEGLNTKTQFDNLQKENDNLKNSNEKYINAITSASHTIGEVLNMISNDPDLLKIPKKTQAYIDEIEKYIVQINNQLMRPSSNDGSSGPSQGPTPKPKTNNIVFPEVPTHTVVPPTQGGRRRRRRKTLKRAKKNQRGGFIHSQSSIFKKSKRSSRRRSNTYRRYSR
jgi:chromosome segregation ATPase